VIIRGYRTGDLGDLCRIGLQTGDHGTDATAQFRDPDLLGHPANRRALGFYHHLGFTELRAGDRQVLGMKLP
jgi:hypothetical protein